MVLVIWKNRLNLEIKKVFYLDEEAKKKRMDFCQKIGEMELVGKKIEGLNVFSTAETLINIWLYKFPNKHLMFLWFIN